MTILSVTSADMPGLVETNWDGIVGLLPVHPSGGDLLVQKMKDQGLINNATFAIRFIEEKYGSEITFGGYNEEIVDNLIKFTFTNLYEHNYWSVGIQSMRYGDLQFGQQAQRGIIDTGTSLLMLPNQDYKRFIESITHQKT